MKQLLPAWDPERRPAVSGEARTRTYARSPAVVMGVTISTACPWHRTDLPESTALVSLGLASSFPPLRRSAVPHAQASPEPPSDGAR